ncbi:MAG: hypothetical protein AB7L92_01950 [Alphaproteobacteria bacterium]
MRNLNPVKPDNPEIMDINPDRKETAGEKIFDRTVYTGIGFGVNEGLSLWVTDQFMHGKNLLAKVPGMKTAGMWFSAEGFDRASEAWTRLLKLEAKNGKTAKQNGANSLLMLTLLSGGTLLLLPMKWLEDTKATWVKKANHMADKWGGNKLTPEQVEARDKEVEQHIACSPRQSWPSFLVGRTIAITSSWASGTFIMGPKRNEQLMDWSEKKLTGSIQPKEHKTTGHRYARLASVETYSCAISSIVLEAMSKLFAKRSSRAHDPELCQKFAAEKKQALLADASESAATDENKKSLPEERAAGRHSASLLSEREMATNTAQTIQI